jgi:hypothetical protein
MAKDTPAKSNAGFGYQFNDPKKGNAHSGVKTGGGPKVKPAYEVGRKISPGSDRGDYADDGKL